LNKVFIPFLIVFKPLKTWKYLLKNVDFKFTVIYMLILASIGPILSFFNITYIEKLPLNRAILYSLTTYFFDTSFSFLFAFILAKLLKLDFLTAFKISVFSQTAIWLSDVVDISQYLRPLSNIGLALSLYSLYLVLNRILSVDKKRTFVSIGIFLILYMVNAFVSELILTNPYLKKILKAI